jgi:hypothetical protein
MPDSIVGAVIGILPDDIKDFSYFDFSTDPVTNIKALIGNMMHTVFCGKIDWFL